MSAGVIGLVVGFVLCAVAVGVFIKRQSHRLREDAYGL
jgi:hypothetical protein